MRRSLTSLHNPVADPIGMDSQPRVHPDRSVRTRLNRPVVSGLSPDRECVSVGLLIAASARVRAVASSELSPVVFHNSVKAPMASPWL